MIESREKKRQEEGERGIKGKVKSSTHERDYYILFKYIRYDHLILDMVRSILFICIVDMISSWMGVCLFYYRA